MLENSERNKLKNICHRNDQKVLEFKEFDNISYKTQHAMLYVLKNWKPILSCKDFPRITKCRPWISEIKINGLCASKLEFVAKVLCSSKFLLVLDLKEIRNAKQFHVESFVQTIKRESKESNHLRSLTIMFDSNESSNIISYSSLVRICTEQFIFLDMLEINLCTIKSFRSVFNDKHSSLIPLDKLNLQRIRLNQNDLKNLASSIEWCWSIRELSLCGVNINNSFEEILNKVYSFRYLQVAKFLL